MIDIFRGFHRRRKFRRLINRPFAETPFGFRFSGPAAMQDGSFEARDTRIIRKLLEDADLFVNIGANFGYYVCQSAQMNVKTIAVEPVPDNVDQLRKNLSENDLLEDVTIFECACGSKAGTAKIMGLGTGASLVDGWARNPSSLSVDVPVRTLDDLLDGFDVSDRTLFLVDVEGFELEVFKGAGKLLSGDANPIFIVETGLKGHLPDGRVNTSFLDLVRLFNSHDFLVFPPHRLDAHVEESELVRALETGKDPVGGGNFFVLRKNGLNEKMETLSGT